jgi:hypothetical protein
LGSFFVIFRKKEKKDYDKKFPMVLMWKSKAFSLLTQVDLRGVSDKAQKENTPKQPKQRHIPN